MKTKMDKKVNRVVRKLNKQLKEDVFKDRFSVRQYQKARVDGIEYYLYELCDKLQPERNQIISWETGFSLTKFHHLHLAMNDFIVNSNFWQDYKNK